MCSGPFPRAPRVTGERIPFSKSGFEREAWKTFAIALGLQVSSLLGGRGAPLWQGLRGAWPATAQLPAHPSVQTGALFRAMAVSGRKVMGTLGSVSMAVSRDIFFTFQYPLAFAH